MWEDLVGRIPNKLILVCTVLTVLVPYVIYKVNHKIHKTGDPPWKKENWK